MASVTISIPLAFAVLIGHVLQGHGADIEQDMCVDREYNKFFQAMNAKFPNLAKFTGAIPAPPVLYDNVFNQSFTKDTYEEYSDEYSRQRSGFYDCKESDYKRMSLYGFDFADFVFVHRREDFSNHLPCIQRSLRPSTPSCSSNCQSYRASAAQANAAGDSYMATGKTCQFQNCTSICGMSSIHSACGFAAASLYRQMLLKVYEVMRNYLEPETLRPKIDSGDQRSPLPKQCRRLALMSGDSGASTFGISTFLVLTVFLNALTALGMTKE